MFPNSLDCTWLGNLNVFVCRYEIPLVHFLHVWYLVGYCAYFYVLILNCNSRGRQPMHKRETQPQLLKEGLEFLEREWLGNKFIENVCYLWFQSSSTRSLSGSLPLQKHKRELSRCSSPLDPSVIICMFEYDLYVFSVISIRAGGKEFCLDLLLYSTFISILSPCYCRATLF